MKYIDIHAHVFPPAIAEKAVCYLEDYYHFTWEGNGLAEDLLGKLAILLLASLIFGFSFVLFRLRIPSAATRFLHIVVLFVPIVLVSQSLVGDATLDLQAYVAYYFFAVLVYLAVYGICMIASSAIRKRLG